MSQKKKKRAPFNVNRTCIWQKEQHQHSHLKKAHVNQVVVVVFPPKQPPIGHRILFSHDIS
jgi:hypothetical protein